MDPKHACLEPTTVYPSKEKRKGQSLLGDYDESRGEPPDSRNPNISFTGKGSSHIM